MSYIFLCNMHHICKTRKNNYEIIINFKNNNEQLFNFIFTFWFNIAVKTSARKQQKHIEDLNQAKRRKTLLRRRVCVEDAARHFFATFAARNPNSKRTFAV